jgi:hypothetical protein
MEFGPSVVPELREILLSTSEGEFYDPDGRLIEVRDVPFLEEWHLSRLDFDPDLGRSRLVCVLTGAGKTVTATIDAGDFAGLRDNTSNTPEWNGSPYHDLAVQLSVPRNARCGIGSYISAAGERKTEGGNLAARRVLSKHEHRQVTLNRMHTERRLIAMVLQAPGENPDLIEIERQPGLRWC